MTRKMAGGQMEGIVIIVQEGRLQLTDDRGVSHFFVLSPHASAETQQLPELQQRQARVRVRYRPAANLIGNVISSIEVA